MTLPSTIDILSLSTNEESIKMEKKEIIHTVFKMLQNREIHPKGTFDSKKRFTALNSDLIDVRAPSAAWPNSHMLACRTKKYVTKVYDKFKCESMKDLIEKL